MVSVAPWTSHDLYGHPLRYGIRQECNKPSWPQQALRHCHTQPSSQITLQSRMCPSSLSWEINLHSLTDITQQELGFKPRPMPVIAQAQCTLCLLFLMTLGQATFETGAKLFTERCLSSKSTDSVKDVKAHTCWNITHTLFVATCALNEIHRAPKIHWSAKP